MAIPSFIPRALLAQLKEIVQPGKVTVIYGPRRAGKTLLLAKYLETVKEPYALYNGEDIQTQSLFQRQSAVQYKSILAGKSLLVIDEAQKIANIGLNLKIVVDNLPRLKIIASGSSSFDLAQKIGEPLTGRKFTLTLYPLWQKELGFSEDLLTTRSLLEERLVFGSYPEIITTPDTVKKQKLLRELAGSYLYKDILEIEGLRKGKKISDLLKLLAFQIGGEVSLTEIGSSLEMSKETVARYLDLLEQSFVLVNIRGFSRNLRKEISKTSRYYFLDIGIRNTVINNFNSLSFRNDVGQLWENYIVVERLKKQAYGDIFANNYFWRTYDRKEIDWVEERGGKLCGYEIKWGEGKVREPKSWKGAYPEAEFKVINRENYLDFII